MAQSSWPFENIDTSETQFSQWARNIGEGVIFGKGLELETFADSTGMNVKVKSGQALVRGHYYSSSAEETLTVPTANPTNPRIDLIVARLDPAANSIVLALVAGTPAGSPVAPTPTQTDSEVYELPLAEVYVGAGVITITSGNVTDVRSIFEPGSAGAGVIFSDTAPEDTDSIWYNTENGNAYLYYDGFWTSITGLPSIPTGGTTGQVLAKSSATDYATQWVAPSAMTLLASQTFTSATSIIIDNVFSSTYNSYQIVLNTTSSAATNEVSVVYRVGGSDATTNYNTQTMDSAAGAFGGFRSTAVASASIGRTATLGCILTASIYGVAMAQSTFTVSSSYDSALTLRTQGSYHSTATAYDGIKFTLPSSTGEVRIYGLEK